MSTPSGSEGVIAAVFRWGFVSLLNGSVWGAEGAAAAAERAETSCTFSIVDAVNPFDLVAEKEGSEDMVTNTSPLMPGSLPLRVP